MRKSALGYGIAMAILLSGCAVGPDFRRPTGPADVGQSFHSAVTGEPAAFNTQQDGQFWSRFEDKQLSRLIGDALKKNYDLKSSWSNYQAAMALLRERRSDLYPTIRASGEAGRQHLSTDEADGAERSSDVYRGSVDASWELDVFGRVRRAVEAQKAETGALASDVAAMQVVIVSEVSSSYFRMRAAQWRKNVALENIDVQRSMLEVVQARVAHGRESDLDLVRQRALLRTTEAKLPLFDSMVAVEQNRLAVLTGRVPGQLAESLNIEVGQIMPPPLIDPGSPAELLRRRPDVIAAEARLHSATAKVGVATADLFPRLSLGAALGTFSFTDGDLFTSRSESRNVLLGIDWSFLDVGRVRSRIASANAEASGLLAAYQKAVLIALEDAENAIVRSGNSAKQANSLGEAYADAKRASDIAQRRYDDGRIGSFELLDVQRSALEAQDAYAQARADQAMAAVELYVALAGGWFDEQVEIDPAT
ncbi:efflux transporter outer membrane subunit [Stenotrophomonas maltophilia]|uniref:efflux transporter outer membrane subunit n=1 Tax=Stenotrophomonas maltophilia TaxID=40324 RepID=UPI00289B1A91|nr:efflux transporter outer membrane subunit [Stenotrophomonas maltophilia]